MNRLPVVLAVPALVFAASGPAAARTCVLSISAADQIEYDKSELVVGSDCDAFEVVLEHVGNMTAEEMGHNWVLTETSDFEAVARDGMEAGMEHDYVAPGDDRVIAHTTVIGGGETASITVEDTLVESGGDYTFFCSFPGHYGLMNGTLVVE